MFRSATTRSKGAATAVSYPSYPSTAVVTAKPCFWNSVENILHNDSSSSTNRMRSGTPGAGGDEEGGGASGADPESSPSSSSITVPTSTSSSSAGSSSITTSGALAPTSTKLQLGRGPRSMAWSAGAPV